MKPLGIATEIDAALCAKSIMDTIPVVMHAIKNEFRTHRPLDLSVPQFRVLAFLHRNPGASLSDAADHIGLTLPTMSKMVDFLVKRRFVLRKPSRRDRRCLTLALSEAGRAAFAEARDHAESGVARLLKPLAPEAKQMVVDSMQALWTAFGSDVSQIGRV